MSRPVALHDEFDAGPYPLYDMMRESSPVTFMEEVGGFDAWLVTRYDDVSFCMKKPAIFGHESFWDEPVSMHDPSDAVQKSVVESFSNIMMYKDDSPHSSMRRVLGPPFAPPKVASRRDQVKALCRDLMQRCREKGTFDFAQDFAYLLPSLVVADYLGIPEEDREFVRLLADRFRVVFEPEVQGDARADMLRDVAPLVSYLDDLIARRRAEPQDDFLSALTAIDEVDGGMTTDELRGNLMHLLLAGNETTTNLLSHMAVQLARTPELREIIAADPTRARHFVEETLRFEAPLQIIARKTREPVTIGNTEIPSGAMVALGVGSANRDPARFDDPDRFDLDRDDKAHLSFAVGAHFCIGAPLARLEGQIAAEMLAGEFRDLEIVADAKPEWKPDLISRGFIHLPARSTQSP
ncbi:cytochrome P450 [Rhodococcus kroppenstedtii]|uniref:cytochrome P450 n=1 Tax=Rhodococcoides kroppenstedtii TaxID=293050 RepID=UPI002954BB99|nr:cytochrome P450 [Rhodococcus kroppenstedtii]MDV7199569.1 cytochrome P450 [Rhodococcus kroppenstedtii]